MNQQEQRIWVGVLSTTVKLAWNALLGRNVHGDKELQLCGGEMPVMANLLQRYLDYFFGAIEADRIRKAQLLSPCMRLKGSEQYG
jgi:hypothetical protein